MATGVDDALARISAKLAELQAQGWEKHADHYNVPGHRLALGPVITLDEVTAFEAKHGALPADYRAFITTIAGSGAGPYHGLRSLDCSDAGTVVLCDQGCGYWAGLRLDGDNRGRVVLVYEDHVTLSPAPSFLAWYEGWLDALLQGVVTRQRITGLVVNDKIALPRDELERLRALLHNCVRTGPAAQNRDGHHDFRAHLLGRISWVAAIDRSKAARLQEAFARIRWDEA